ncbi:MAG: glycosyltransferase [Bacillota bacterium]|nr:glycosyltransferase [Bacillota bacterium]
MKILILSVTAGGGHLATARAMEDMFKKKGADVKVIDIYRYINRFLYSIIDKGCAFSTSKTPDIFGAVYSYLEKRNEPETEFDIMQLVNALCAFRFESFIENLNPDAIICTHVFAAQIVNELKKKNKIEAPAVGIITDYTIHPYWGSVSYIEHINLASEMLVYHAVKRGIKKERITAFGIPVGPKFCEKKEKTEARRILNLPLHGKTVLVMSGSLGQADMLDMSRQISRAGQDITQLLVCGKNKRLFTKLCKYKDENNMRDLYIYGYADNVDLLMDASDCIITKPGGITVSEALVKCLPMIIIDPIPGHEERNSEFLLNNGVCIEVSKTFPLEEAVNFLLENPQRAGAMRNYMAALGKPNSTENIANFVMGLRT